MSRETFVEVNFVRRSPNGTPPKCNMTGLDDPSLQTEVVEKSAVEMHDFRQLASSPSLDKEGFQLERHDTNVNFDDDQQVRAVYYQQMEELVCRATGAERAVLFDHTIRKVVDPSKMDTCAAAAPGGKGLAGSSLGD